MTTNTIVSDGSAIGDGRMAYVIRADRPSRSESTLVRIRCLRHPRGCRSDLATTLRRAKLRAMRLELTHRGSYAIRAVLALARSSGEDVVPARRIAKEMDIPARFLPQVLGDLNRAGIVEARLGRAGGYRLSRPAADISLLDIIQAAEGDARRQTCVLTGKPCDGIDPCDVHDMFYEAQEAILQRLDGVSVAAVVAGGDKVPGVAGGPASGA